MNSPSPARDAGPAPMAAEREDVETIDVSDEDAAFVLGRGGSTKRKLARVSGARLELHDGKGRGGKSVLEIAGDPASRERAKDYVKFVLTQRVGPVHIDPTMKRDDMSIVQVPEDCVGFVMGKGGQVLRSMEDEWGTLMFFAKNSANATSAASGPLRFGGEILAIFGTRRGRRGAELKVMSAVEHKHKGTFMDETGALRVPLSQPGDDEDDGFDYDTFPFRGDEYSYALGSKGSTRKKLAAASGAIIEYVGQVAILAGLERERKQAREYLEWLMRQRTNEPIDVDVDKRDDVTVVSAPRSAMGYITGHKGDSLRGIERDTNTFIFAAGSGKKKQETEGGDDAMAEETKAGDGSEKILIFGDVESDRRRAKRVLEERIQQALRGDRRRDDRGGRRDRDDSRDRRGPRRDDRRDYRDDRRDDRYRDDRYRDDRRGRSRSPPRNDRRGRSRSPPPRYDSRDRRRSPPRYRDRSPEDRRGGGRQVCFDWQKGRCNRERCKFAHDDGPRERDRSRDRR